MYGSKISKQKREIREEFMPKTSRTTKIGGLANG